MLFSLVVALGGAQSFNSPYAHLFASLCQPRGKGGVFDLLVSMLRCYEDKLHLCCDFVCFCVNLIFCTCATMYHVCYICVFYAQK